MSFLLALALVVASGLGVLRLLRLGTGTAAVDVPLAWFVGGAWLAAAAMAARFLAGVPDARWSALAICAVPITVWLLPRGRGRAPALPPQRARWLGRPAWVFGPIAAYALAVTVAVALHGFNTPTHTDDGFRVRAFAPVLAFDDAWGPEAGAVLLQAGPVPTFVPSLAWKLTGRVDHFHVNYAVLATLAAFLALAVGVSAARGAPERGWATAFAALSLPLFVYHCTSTYSDAVLAMHCGAGFLFHLEYSQRRRPEDAARALLLYVAAAMVKQEGEVVAATCAAFLVAEVASSWRRGPRVRARWVAPPLVAYALVLASRAALAGAGAIVPLVGHLLAGATGSASRPPASGLRAMALQEFADALFWSGNAGMLFWVAPAALALRAREVRRRGLSWPLAVVAALLAESAVSSVWIFPAYTVDESTVHRALLTVSVAASVWLAALLAPPPPGGWGPPPGPAADPPAPPGRAA